MKKILFNTLPVAMVMLASLSACSSDDVANEGNGKGEPQLDIKLSENDFGSGDDATRYIMADSYVVDSQQVDLGNGYVADVVITKDPAESSDDNTRALGDGNGEIGNARTGGYTVKAYGQSGTTYNYTFTGTTNGSGVFTKTGDWTIKKGNYKFFCYRTDGFVAAEQSGVYLLGVSSAWSSTGIGNQDRSLLSDPVTKEIVSGSNAIDFTLKQKACGVRVKFASNPTTNTFSNLAGILTAPANVTAYMLPSFSPLRKNSGTESKTLSFTNNTSDYIYYPDNIAATGMKIKFTGGKVLIPTKEGFDPLSVDLTNKEIALSGFTTTSANRYTVNITIKTSTLYRTVVSTLKSMTANPTQADKDSWGSGTITFSNNNGCSVVSPFSATYDNMVFGYKDGSVDVTATPDAHSVYYTTSTTTGLTYIQDNNFTVTPKDMHGKIFTVAFLKKWQESTDGYKKILRVRLGNGTVVPIVKKQGESVLALITFTANGSDSSFKYYEDNVEKTAVGSLPALSYSYDANTGIYTITIDEQNPTQCYNTKGNCTNNAYLNLMLHVCPITCEALIVPDAYK